jgi:hypothetical protein
MALAAGRGLADVAATSLYEGRRLPTGCVVTVDGVPLEPRFDLARMADDFEWGYDGNGPRQLALALLADHRGDGAAALADYRRLTGALIETLDGDSWRLTGAEIDRAMAAFLQVPTDLKGLLARVRGEG